LIVAVIATAGIATAGIAVAIITVGGGSTVGFKYNYTYIYV